jgi:hypothetical protein
VLLAIFSGGNLANKVVVWFQALLIGLYFDVVLLVRLVVRRDEALVAFFVLAAAARLIKSRVCFFPVALHRWYHAVCLIDRVFLCDSPLNGTTVLSTVIRPFL